MYPLYYVAYTQKQSVANELGYMKEQYINVKINYSAKDELKELEANKCYVSQFTQKELEEDYNRKIIDKQNTAYFRRFVVEKNKRIKKDFL
jgi:predicted methyltransferase